MDGLGVVCLRNSEGDEEEGYAEREFGRWELGATE